MIRNKQEQQLFDLTKEFEEKSKEMNKIIEKITQKEKQIEIHKLDIVELTNTLTNFENEIIDLLKRRQKLNKKMIGKSNAE